MKKRERGVFVTSDDRELLLIPSYSEEQLIEGARRGSRAHVDQLIRRFGPSLVERISRFDRDVTDLGVLSEVALRLPTALENYEHREKLDAFLWTIARSIIVDMQRQRQRRSREVAPQELGLKRPSSPQKELEIADLVDRLTTALSPRARDVWTRHLAGFSNQDTAEALGMTANAVGAMLSRSKRILQDRAGELHLQRADFERSGLNSDFLLGQQTQKE
ncbi:MAG TPA: sigma-70 family RNA polymerase sigma factor [Gemmatimonadaceae bacterium]|jgi:RNA polymerase sigma factor (sigma-70 family)